MAKVDADAQQVNARIVFWGVEGAGITSNLQSIYAKLKASNRGELRRIATRIDPTVEYELLPIELGKVNGIQTRLQVIGVPGHPEQAPTRKHLLDQIDGIVFVVDSRPERLDENLQSLNELRASLANYGHDFDEIPLVIQYNKCDLVDDIAIERLHREIDVAHAVSFDAAAHDGTGVLKTLTTISKLVIRSLGKREGRGTIGAAAPAETDVAVPSAATAQAAVAATPPAPAEPAVAAPPAAPLRTPVAAPPAAPAPPIAAPPLDRPAEAIAQPAQANAPSGSAIMEAAILLEGEGPDEGAAADAATDQARLLLDQTWDALTQQHKPAEGARIGADLRIVSVGTAERSGDRAITLPLVLGNDEGESITLALSIQLDPMLDDEP